jgi:hypothetical protein
MRDSATDLVPQFEPGRVERIGVALHIEDDHVIVRWVQSVGWSDELEYRAHRADVEPLDGWV